MTKNDLSWLEYDIKCIEEVIQYIDDPKYGPDFARGYLKSMKQNMLDRYNENKTKIEDDNVYKRRPF